MALRTFGTMAVADAPGVQMKAARQKKAPAGERTV
jgi:hypothetical protein